MTAALYQQVWDIPAYRDFSPGEHVAQTFVEVASPDDTIIDFGCGSGKGSRMLHVLTGQKVIGLDWAENSNQENIEFHVHDLTKPVPFKSEYGFCTDVMEHISPNEVDKVLANILTAARNVFFSISMVPDHFGAQVGEPLHLTVENFDWWKNKLETEHHCRIKWSKEAYPNALFYVTAYANGDDFAKVTSLNAKESDVVENIRKNLGLGLQEICPHETQETQVILLAGGPSLVEHEQEIIQRGKAGELIVTTNGTYNWLIERGIRPAAQVMVDSRPFMKRFTEPHIDSCKYLMASQVDHEIIASLPKDQTYLWHCGDSDLVKDAVDKWTAENDTNREWWPVYGGTTVVLRALPLLAMLGFRKVEVFGWDSCLLGGKHHSYEQPENDGGIVFPVMVGGETFACNPWMIVQANELGKVVRSILGKIDGFEMAVRGDGLIAHMLKTAADLSERKENGS